MKKKLRQIAIEYLTEWGEWEATGRYSAREQRSQLDRFIRNGVGGDGSGAASTPNVRIPDKISKTSRAMAELKGINPRQYRAIWLFYVRQYKHESIDRLGDTRDNALRAEEMGVQIDTYQRILADSVDTFVFLLWQS